MTKRFIKQVRKKSKIQDMYLIEESFEDGLSDEEIAQAFDINPREVRNLRFKYRGDD